MATGSRLGALFQKAFDDGGQFFQRPGVLLLAEGRFADVSEVCGQFALGGLRERRIGAVLVQDEGRTLGVGAGGDEGMVEACAPEENKRELHVLRRPAAEPLTAERLPEDLHVREFVRG